MITRCLIIVSFIVTCHAAFPRISDVFSNNNVNNRNPLRLTVMTFNAWISGANVHDGVQKIVRHIETVQPDIVGFQEMSDLPLDTIMRALSKTANWSKCDQNGNYNNAPFIITTLPVVSQHQPSTYLRNVGCQIRISQVPDTVINVWNLHLNAYPYGPHELCVFHSARTESDLMKVEYDDVNSFAEKRLNTVQKLLKHGPFADNLLTSHYQPVILTGDFNSPSHLDWTRSNRHAHCNMSFEWPTTKALHDSGFRDSYREMYPNPSTHPGITWSPIYITDTKEVQDRIDLILYKGQKLRPVYARVYDGNQRMSQHPNHMYNDWPSDHSSVVTDFDVYL